MSTEIVDVHQVAPGKVLAGKLSGEQAKPAFDEVARGVPEGSIVLLDLARVGLLSGSYYLAALRSVFWDSTGKNRDLYPILYRANAETAGEIQLALKAMGVPGLLADGPAGNLTVRPQNMDGQAKETFDLLLKLGEATAGDLLERSSARISKTGWSNRLASLHQHRILRRWKLGRELVYAPCWREK